VSIPESQLTTWSNQGAVTTAKDTRVSIYTALSSASKLKARVGDAEVFLQGSYANDTNIRGDSDVDVVALPKDIWVPDTSHLSPQEAERQARAYSKSDYHWSDFRGDVLGVLQGYYGALNVTSGNKSLKLKAGSGRLAADIVPVLLYRRYQRFVSVNDQSYVEGIWFKAKDGREVINYPKQHYDNGVSKNARDRTNGRFKPVVRLFKNARTYLIDHGKIADDLAPSYFLQCLLYNVPDNLFVPRYQETYTSVLKWLRSASLTTFVCQNKQLPLFGTAPEQWSITNVQALIKALSALWDGW
jgi:hypothetical protein